MIAAGPKAYRVHWESGLTNRVEQGHTIVWRYDDWKDYSDKEIARIEDHLGIVIRAQKGAHP